MTCATCGKEVDASNKFCPNCGNELNDANVSNTALYADEIDMNLIKLPDTGPWKNFAQVAKVFGILSIFFQFVPVLGLITSFFAISFGALGFRSLYRKGRAIGAFVIGLNAFFVNIIMSIILIPLLMM